uniref:Uncharacterized protein n=1 Tax=Heterosigma akashiwo TaxID=2829 RepID=A0A7S3XZ86_HETAK
MLVVLALGCAFVLLVIGSSLPAVNILFEGLAGKLLGGSSSRHYSALSLGEDLPSNTLHPNGVGIRWIQSIYFMFTFAMPSVFLLSSMLVWIIPMSHSAVNRAHQFLEIVGAWTATDVLLLSVLATVLEISIFADFMVGDDCDFINSVLSQYQMDLGLTDAVCFSLRVKEQRGAWVILCHVILTYLSGAVVNAVAQCGCHQYFNADKFTPVDGQLMQAKHYKQQLVQPPVLSSVNNSSEWYSCEEDRGGDGIFPRHAHNQEPRVLHDPLVQKDKHQTEKGILEEASISCGSNTESHHREINPLFWMMILISKKYLGLLEELHYCTEEPDKGVDNHGGAYVAGDNN